jgi:PAS domain S-box-containing protein
MPISPDPDMTPDASATPTATATAAVPRWAMPAETEVVLTSASSEPTEPEGSTSSTTGLASSPVAATATPVARETATPVSVEAIMVEAMTSDHEVTPGQPNHYRFQLTNTVGSAVAIQPTAVNSLAGWTGVVLQEDGATTLDGLLTIGPWQSTIVVVAVTVPADARVGDRNTISLRLGLAPAEQPAEWSDFPQIEPSRKRFGQVRIGRRQYRRRRERIRSRTRRGAGASGESVRDGASGAKSSMVAKGRTPHGSNVSQDVHGPRKMPLSRPPSDAQDDQLKRHPGTNAIDSGLPPTDPSPNTVEPATDLAEAATSDALTATHMRTVFDWSSEAIFVTDADGTFLDANPAALAMLGRDKDELPRFRVNDLVAHGFDWSTEVNARLVQEGFWEGEVTFRTKDGNVVWTEVESRALEGLSGPRYVSFVRELPKRSQAEMTQARLAAMVTSSADAIIGGTLDGTITDWNQAAEQLYGYTAAEAVGQPLEILTPPERAGEIDELLARVRRRESIPEIETVRRTKSGRLIDVSVRISPVPNSAGQIIGTSTVARDISVRKAVEAERAATHQNTREVLARITDGFYALDRDWRFTYLNSMAEQILGRTRREILGKTIWEELDQAAGAPVYAAYKRAMAEGVTTSVEFYDLPLGRWFEARAYPSAGGVSVFFRDVTASKELERRLRASESKYRTLVEQIPAVVYVLAADELQTPLYFSPRIHELTGETPEEALGLTKHWLEQVHPDDYARVSAEDARTTATGEPFRMEYRQLRKDGSYVWVRDECMPVLDESGQVVAWQGVLLDVSARVQLQAAQEATRVKTMILGMMSHELRTPMQSVLGYAALLLGGYRGSLTPEQVEDIGYIQLGANRMMTLVEQMLDLSRMEADQLQLAAEPVDLTEIVEQVRRDIAPQAAVKSLDLRIDLPPSLPLVIGDPDRLRQIVFNLVDNAVKFTERGAVRISACPTEQGVEIVVRDTGIGIAADALDHIFEEFRQVDSSSSRPYGGAGLGLAISHKLAELMGGSISVVSAPQVGSTFTLHLPAATTAGTTSRTS